MTKPGLRLVTTALALCVGVPAAVAQTEPPATLEVEAPPPPPPPARKGSPIGSIVYDGGLVFRSDDGKFELKLNGLLQSRWELISTKAGDGDRDSVARFVLPRARMGMSGYAWKNTQFKVEFSFSDAGNTRLRDFYLNQVFLDGKVQLRLGQWKRPFNRSEIVSDFATEFVEKAVTNVFGSRDIGIGLTNAYEKSPDGLEWVIALFNGRGDGTTFPVNCTTPMGGGNPTCNVGTPTSTPGDYQPQLQARVGFNHGGIKGYSEGDLEGGPLRFAAGVSYRGSNLQDTDAAPLLHDVDIDAVIKVAGLDVWAAFFLEKKKDVDAQFAFSVQAGYMVVPRTVQIAARFAMVPVGAVNANGFTSPADGVDQEYTQEIRGAFNWFFSHSHSLKWATDFGMTKDTTEGANAAIQLRTGAQLIF